MTNGNEPTTVDANLLRQTLGKLLKEQLPGPSNWVDKLFVQAVNSIASGEVTAEPNRKI